VPVSALLQHRPAREKKGECSPRRTCFRSWACCPCPRSDTAGIGMQIRAPRRVRSSPDQRGVTRAAKSGKNTELRSDRPSDQQVVRRGQTLAHERKQVRRGEHFALLFPGRPIWSNAETGTMKKPPAKPRNASEPKPPSGQPGTASDAQAASCQTPSGTGQYSILPPERYPGARCNPGSLTPAPRQLADLHLRTWSRRSP